jgi:hypothetical protein
MSSYSLKSVLGTTLPFVLMFAFLGLGYSGEIARHGSKTFRCENDIVSLGDSMADVILRCGEPTYRQTTGVRGKARTTTRRSSKSSQGNQNDESRSGKRKQTSGKTEYKEQVTETWYYNRGPNDFVYSLSFEGGTLTKIDKGKRGK